MALPGEALLRAGIVPVPPGEFFEKRFLKPRGMSIHQAADQMGVETLILDRFVHRQIRVDQSLAEKLAGLTDTSVEFWLNMQSATDLAETWDAVD